MSEAQRLGWIQRTGSWLLVLPSTFNGTELWAQEWRDYLFLCYGIYPPDLTSHFDGCGSAFKMFHALGCKKGALITVCHNELRDGVADLAAKAFTQLL